MDYVRRYHLWAFFTYGVLSLLLFASSALVTLRLVRSPRGIVLFYLLLWLAFVTYWAVRYFAPLSARSRYLFSTIPPLVLMFVASLFSLAGFFAYLVRNGWRLFDGGVTNAQLVVLQLLVVLVLAIPWSVRALIDTRRMLRTRHHLDGTVLRFYNMRKEVVVDLAALRSLVVGQHVVLLCQDSEEEEHAIEYVNRPTSRRLWPRLLEGVLYLETEGLVKELRGAGFAVVEDHFATIVRQKA